MPVEEEHVGSFSFDGQCGLVIQACWDVTEAPACSLEWVVVNGQQSGRLSGSQ
jgi:hypothetical protein